ncbi:hypothetical protein ACEN33_04865 [Ruoffia sp. FAM 24228]|uniref:hypothetical protein n=1 Tax=unclassified Ruoffia TaxID=2862149 RepID=UPI003885FF0C
MLLPRRFNSKRNGSVSSQYGWIKGIARDQQNLPLANISPIALKERILNEF